MQNTQRSRRFQISLACALLLGFSLSLRATVADPVQRTIQPGALHPELRTILSTATSVTDELLQYPSGGPALITAVEITFEPGQQTGWHTHPVPLFGYMLEGELTVDYGAQGQRIYRKGDALLEAMSTAHNGRNMGQSAAKILAVFIGTEGAQGSVPASPFSHK
jgi:quercetin dioxygenase-like cupin family protein